MTVRLLIGLTLFCGWVTGTEANELAPSSVTLPVVSVAVDFPGFLFVPNDGHPHPGIVVLQSSEGRMAPDVPQEAQWLASQGFAVMALCSFDADLSKTYEAFRWLRTSLYVQDKPTALYGVSRGAEQALVLAVYLSKRSGLVIPNAVVAHALSSSREGGIPNPGVGNPAWSWKGRLDGLQPGSEIQIDRYSGNLLVTHGNLDEEGQVGATQKLEAEVRASGASVQTCIQSKDPAAAPLCIAEPLGGPVGAEFTYFEDQGNVFSKPMNQVRLNQIADFLKRTLGN